MEAWVCELDLTWPSPDLDLNLSLTPCQLSVLRVLETISLVSVWSVKSKMQKHFVIACLFICFAKCNSRFLFISWCKIFQKQCVILQGDIKEQVKTLSATVKWSTKSTFQENYWERNLHCPDGVHFINKAVSAFNTK